MDGCCWHAGFDQVDPPAIHDLVVGRRGDSHGPAEMMSDTQTHDVEYGASQYGPPKQFDSNVVRLPRLALGIVSGGPDRGTRQNSS